MSARTESQRRKIVSSIATVIALLISPLTQAGQATGTVNVISVNVFWGGLFVQLDNPVTQQYEAACPSADWAFLPLTEPTYNSIYATLLAAKMSGQVVVVYTNGCVTVPAGTQPRIWVVDAGIRAPGS